MSNQTRLRITGLLAGLLASHGILADEAVLEEVVVSGFRIQTALEADLSVSLLK